MLKHPSEEKRFFNVQLRDDDGELREEAVAAWMN